MTLSRAAELVGVDGTTAREWLARGEGRDERPTKPIYVAFASAIQHARAQDEQRRVKRIEQAAAGGTVVYEKITSYPDGREVREVRRTPPEWQADAWHLERSKPEEWGRKDRLDVHHILSEEIQRITDDPELTDEEKRTLIRDVEAYAYGRA